MRERHWRSNSIRPVLWLLELWLRREIIGSSAFVPLKQDSRAENLSNPFVSGTCCLLKTPTVASPVALCSLNLSSRTGLPLTVTYPVFA